MSTDLTEILGQLKRNTYGDIGHVDYDERDDTVSVYLGGGQQGGPPAVWRLSPDNARFMATMLVEYAEKGNKRPDRPRYNSAVIVLKRIVAGDFMHFGKLR